ncbi:hypothetical protein BDV98DRAFT_599838 [Pterulicium gracile]|uniref:JmjC domain-containing protein n=1 Tax=Pterulicium gracile TaxID=1884261 RepID=A0A5C3R2Y9_9AGAR|nr:hypothetical protein BDV98DRAFT_599838 [Pterula gracilis]
MVHTEQAGSSSWFMTSTESSAHASEYFAKQLRHVLDHETHFVSPQDLENAAFPIYYYEQRLGDCIIIPPRSCHQVVNHGGITIKMSWSRLLVQDLPAALYSELPLYQRVCRRETYAIKSVIRESLKERTIALQSVHQGQQSTTSVPNSHTLAEELQLLVFLHQTTLQEERPLMISTGKMAPFIQIEAEEEPEGLFCDFCGADIFNAFFECQSCIASHDSTETEPSLGEAYCVCPRCYIDGRSCPCERMKPMLLRNPALLRAELDSALRVLDLHFSISDSTAEAVKAPLLKYKSRNIASIFEAGNRLYQRREHQAEKDRMCSVSRKLKNKANHRVLASSVIHCSKCHAATCLTHILEIYRIHAGEALLRDSDDETSTSWHKRHIAASKNAVTTSSSAENITRVAGAAPPDGLFSLAQSAKLFKRCKPLSQDFSLGWYDTLSVRPRRVRRPAGYSGGAYLPALQMPSSSVAEPRPETSVEDHCTHDMKEPQSEDTEQDQLDAELHAMKEERSSSTAGVQQDRGSKRKIAF